jgi:hypothetical protein
MRKSFLSFIFCLLSFVLLKVGALFCMFTVIGESSLPWGQNSMLLHEIKNQEMISFRTGDLLVRPNLNWMPGSSNVPFGRNFGHVVIVMNNASGKNIEEVLRNTIVAEAVVFDQKTKRFNFNPMNQVRISTADISFGKQFKGIRYRLRMDITEEQQKLLTDFLYKQVGRKYYNILAMKCGTKTITETNKLSKFSEPESWNCATLAWFAFKQLRGIDIDSNKGYLVYPNDILRCACFNSTEGRLRF